MTTTDPDRPRARPPPRAQYPATPRAHQTARTQRRLGGGRVVFHHQQNWCSAPVVKSPLVIETRSPAPQLSHSEQVGLRHSDGQHRYAGSVIGVRTMSLKYHARDMIELHRVLEHLSVGERVAEDERKKLGEYFVETDQFRRILNGDADVVFGPKGSGKSAIYTSILARQDELFDRGITLVAGEVPRGTPAFNAVVAEPPTNEVEFIALWKLYLLSLVDGVLGDFDVRGPQARMVRKAVGDAGLGPGVGGLRGLVGRVREYVSQLAKADSVEGGICLDLVTGSLVGLTGKIVLSEPSSELRDRGVRTVDELLRHADQALEDADVSLWVLFDRLDVAFADSAWLEANALRALFRVYLDSLELNSIRMKIFLRTDIWRSITSGGFREASHVVRTTTIEWTAPALLSLVVNRLLNNPDLVEYTGANVEVVGFNAVAKRAWFDSLVPDQIHSGPKNSKTFEWILGRVRDGLGLVAPREIIHVFDQARQRQLESLEMGELGPQGKQVFGRSAFRESLPEVSKVRLEQTLFAEYPELKCYLEALEGKKTSQTVESLADLWDIGEDAAATIANRAVEVGFFEKQKGSQVPDYWVPFLYRPALAMVQGAAS
jgi:hypothetical protein